MLHAFISRGDILKNFINLFGQYDTLFQSFESTVSLYLKFKTLQRFSSKAFMSQMSKWRPI